jgi:hypothetical protein
MAAAVIMTLPLVLAFLFAQRRFVEGIATTGLAAMDYRLTDPHADPPGMTEGHYVERLLRLPDCTWCYQPSALSCPPAPPADGQPFEIGMQYYFSGAETQTLYACEADDDGDPVLVELVSVPLRPAVRAAARPAGPAPMISRSQCRNPLSQASGSSCTDSAPRPAARRISGSYSFSQNAAGHMKVL